MDRSRYKQKMTALFTFELFINPNGVHAAGANLLAAIQWMRLEDCAHLPCPQCCCPLLERKGVDPKTLRMFDYVACCYCQFKGIPR